MKAAVIYRHGGLEEIVIEDHFTDPEIGPDDALIKVGATSVNYHDIFVRRGMPGIKINLPLITGSDAAGQIVELGATVNDWEIGDRVLLDSGRQEGGRRHMLGETEHGTRSELLRVRSCQLIALPDEISFETASALPSAYGTAHRMMVPRGKVGAGDRVLILGASGGVGTGCLLLAKLAGAEVVVCASSDDKLQRLHELGADHLINYKTQDFRKQIYRLYGKPRVIGCGGVEVVVNFTGGSTWVESLKCLAKGGRMLVCGATAGYDPPTDLRYIWTFEHNILGSDGWSAQDLQALLELIDNKTLMPVIDRVLPLNKAREAERLLEEREVFGKVVIVP